MELRYAMSCNVKSASSQVPLTAGAYPGFRSIKRLGVFLLPPGWDASPLQDYPSSKFAGTHLYTWVERGTMRVNCYLTSYLTIILRNRAEYSPDTSRRPSVARSSKIIALFLNKLSMNNIIKLKILQLCNALDKSWQATYIAGYVLCMDDGYQVRPDHIWAS